MLKTICVGTYAFLVIAGTILLLAGIVTGSPVVREFSLAAFVLAAEILLGASTISLFVDQVKKTRKKKSKAAKTVKITA